jgi:hypothetical protein
VIDARQQGERRPGLGRLECLGIADTHLNIPIALKDQNRQLDRRNQLGRIVRHQVDQVRLDLVGEERPERRRHSHLRHALARLK